jgi:hypothetical protein
LIGFLEENENYSDSKNENAVIKQPKANNTSKKCYSD